MAFYTGAAQLNLPRSPDAYAHQYFAMNAALPSIRPGDILAWSTWRPNHRISSASSSAPLTPPMTSTFESKSTGSTHIHPSSSPPPPHSMQIDQPVAEHRPLTILPPITQLHRQIHSLPPLTPPEDDNLPSSRLELPKMATIPSDADFFEPRQQTPPIIRREPQTSPSTTQQHISSLTAMDTSVPPPEVTPNTSAAAASIISTLALAPAPTSYMVDWLDFTRTRSAHFIAEKTCEMICYLWFSIPSHARVAAELTVGESELPKAKAMSAVASLQLIATPAFVSFMQKLLETTQVSQSVIVLSLHYIHRLKEKNAYTPAQSGSEFRIAVTGLMMANKFLDDNTYTNKTWSEVSGISLDEINRMEREFLLGVDFNLYVDKTTYASWLNLLKGLVHAKERDARRLLRGGMRASSSARRGMVNTREGRFWHPHHGNHMYGAHPRFGSTGPASRTYTTAATANALHGNGAPMDLFSTRRQPAHPAVGEKPTHPYRHRARSTSPRSFTFSSSAARSVAVPHVQEQQSGPPEVCPKPQQGEQSAYSHQYYQPVQPTASSAVPSMDYSYPSSPTPTRNQPVSDLTTSTGTKRTAADAFASPPSSAFIPQQNRLRRPASLYGRLHTLQIPEFSSTSLASSSSVASSIARRTSTSNPSPLESLGGFERMTLDGEERARERGQREAGAEERRQAKRARAQPPVATVIPQTLMAAYSADEAKRAALPKNLFFYTLASSPSADEKALRRERLQQLQNDRTQSGSSDAIGHDTEPEPYFEPRARKAKLRCQAAQPVKYGYNYADLNNFATTRYAPLYSYHEPSSQSSAQGQQAYVSTSNLTPVSPTPTRHIPHTVSYPHSHSESHSHRQSQAMSSQPTAVPFPSTHGQLSHAAVVQSGTASPASYPVGTSDAPSCALPHFRDDVWARTPLPARALQQQAQSPSVCVTGLGQVTGTKWFEGGRQKEEQVINYSDSPAVQTTSSAAMHSAVHTSSPYRNRYASANVSTSSSHPGSAASSPYYQQQQQNIRRQILQDVPSAPFANAGPPGVGVQFYATPEVQQVQVQVPIPVQTPGVYNPSSYPTYSSSSSVVNAASTQFYPGPHSVSHGPTYTYSGAHSTSNSPYHSAASGSYRYTDYSGQNTSPGYRY